jgi:hypothetical protein
MRNAIVVVVAVILLASTAVFAAEPAALQPFAFLVGEWRASGSGKPGAASGTAVFTRGLQDRVIVRTSYAEYPPKAGKPGSRHDDLMVIYADASGGVRADYYDSEGHVIRYAVVSPAAGQAVFVSEAAGREQRFRLSYALEPAGLLKGEFAIAPAGTRDAFTPYLTWESHKAQDAAR